MNRGERDDPAGGQQRRQLIIGILVLLFSLAAVGMSWWTTKAQREFVQCQARVNDAVIERTRILSDATQDERTAQRAADDAERALFTDPATLIPAQDRTPAQKQRLLDLFRRYQAALVTLDAQRVRADQARTANPVPAPPSQACG